MLEESTREAQNRLAGRGFRTPGIDHVYFT
jgi:hypothetical protein